MATHSSILGWRIPMDVNKSEPLPLVLNRLRWWWKTDGGTLHARMPAPRGQGLVSLTRTVLSTQEVLNTLAKWTNSTLKSTQYCVYILEIHMYIGDFFTSKNPVKSQRKLSSKTTVSGKKRIPLEIPHWLETDKKPT